MRMSEKGEGCRVEALPTGIATQSSPQQPCPTPAVQPSPPTTLNPHHTSKTSLTINNNQPHGAITSNHFAVPSHCRRYKSTTCTNATTQNTLTPAIDGNALENGEVDTPLEDYEGSVDWEKLDARFEFRVPGQHMYRGIMMGVLSPIQCLQELESFDVRDDDIVVSGYPKSGTTWLEEIVYLIQHEGNTALSDSSPNYLRIPYLEGQYQGKMLRSLSSPRVYKTHLPHRLLPSPLHRAQTKVVHILRNPRDTAVSYFHFHRTLSELGKFAGSWHEFLDMFMCGYVCYGDWFSHTRDWWRRRDDHNVLIVTYEEMKQAPRDAVLKIARFCGKMLDETTIDRIIEHTSFESMSGNPMLNFAGVPNIDTSISSFMRKGKVGDWKNHFTVAQSELFKTLEQDRLADIPDLPYAPK